MQYIVIYVKYNMGNNNDRLKVFENIIDEANGDFDNFINSAKGKKQFNDAIREKNISYIFMAMTFFGINLDSDYGNVQLTYGHLLKQNIDKFTKNDLIAFKNIITGFEKIDVINTFYKKKFRIICENINENLENNYNYLSTLNNLGLTPFANAIIEGDVNKIKIMIKCYHQQLDSYCNMDKFYSIRDLLLENYEDNMWNVIYKFMEKDYDFTKIRQFIFDTIQIKKEFFEIFKLGILCRFPKPIIHKIINVYHECDTNIIQQNNMINIESDISSLITFNDMLCECNNIPTNFITFMDSIENMEGLKNFWYWSHFNDDIILNKDIIRYIYQIILQINDYDNRIPLLFIK